MPEPASALELGAATEALFACAFAEAALITARKAARLIGVDAKTLRALTDAGVVRATPRGKLYAYAEAELRRYLTCESAPARARALRKCPSTNPPKAVSQPPRHSAQILDFSLPPPGRPRTR